MITISSNSLITFRWKWNPMSKTVGNFSKAGFNISNKTLDFHDFTAKLRESGYSNNVNQTFDKKGFLPHPVLHSDMTRTEYRIQFRKKDVHYKGPLYSTGKLKTRELNYKHT
jgi:hypothetical protein